MELWQFDVVGGIYLADGSELKCLTGVDDHSCPRSPTTTGKIERFHRSLRTEFLMEKKFESFDHAQSELDCFVASYNNERPHQGIDMALPNDRFLVPSPTISSARSSAQPSSTGTWVARRIGANGVFSIAWQQISIGKHKAGLDVDVLVTDSMIHILLK
jgi:hypothetical protein